MSATVTQDDSTTNDRTAEARDALLEDLYVALEPFWDKHMEIWSPGLNSAVSVVILAAAGLPVTPAAGS